MARQAYRLQLSICGKHDPETKREQPSTAGVFYLRNSVSNILPLRDELPSSGGVVFRVVDLLLGEADPMGRSQRARVLFLLDIVTHEGEQRTFDKSQVMNQGYRIQSISPS